MEKFLKNKLPKEYMDKVARDLFMGMYVKQYITKNNANNRWGLQFKTIVLDHNCNVRLCCAIKEILTKVFDLSPKEIDDWRKNNATCKRCFKFWVEQPF